MRFPRAIVARQSGWEASSYSPRSTKPSNTFCKWTISEPHSSLPAGALAGLWENWKSPAGEWVRSFAIVTTEPNDLCAELHNRMPVILAPETWPSWLGEEPADEAQLKSLLVPYPSDNMICWPVNARWQRQEQRCLPDRADRCSVDARSASEILSTWTIIG